MPFPVAGFSMERQWNALRRRPRSHAVARNASASDSFGQKWASKSRPLPPPSQSTAVQSMNSTPVARIAVWIELLSRTRAAQRRAALVARDDDRAYRTPREAPRAHDSLGAVYKIVKSRRRAGCSNQSCAKTDGCFVFRVRRAKPSLPRATLVLRFERIALAPSVRGCR
jgi:hypothetical protein